MVSTSYYDNHGKSMNATVRVRSRNLALSLLDHWTTYDDIVYIAKYYLLLAGLPLTIIIYPMVNIKRFEIFNGY